MGTISNTIFSGNSRFASDFQTIIDRTVGIASLPLKQIQASQTTLSNQSAAWSSLDSKFAALQMALGTVESALGLNSYTSSTSNAANTAVLSATLSSGVSAATYTIEVTGLGSSTNTMSHDALPAVRDPAVSSISSAGNFTLTVNGANFTIQPPEPTMNALVTAINNAGSAANVQASVVNIGTTSLPDYRLAIQSTLLGANTVQLHDGVQNLLTTQVTGALASYKINGGTTAVQSNSRTITLAPGVTVHLLAQSAAGDATTLTVARSAAGVSSALASWVAAYNAAADELARHHGQNPGALAGQSILSTAAAALRTLATYSDRTGASLTSLGLTLDATGHLSLDAAAFSGATASQFSALSTFLGSSGAPGSGFLKSATDSLNGLEDATSGVFKTGITSLQMQMTNSDTALANAQARVDAMKQDLMTRMAATDALIAGLEQKYSYLSTLFTSMQPQK